VILLELIITIVLFSMHDHCGSYCDPYSFVNPFGLVSGGPFACIAMCAWRPHQYFFLAADVLIITIIISLLIRIFKRITKK
jgi:hypothetical protein